ncbi:MAG: EamA family transporter [Hymenobacteraceae bacterium]|nr:EamA family transporter [Hymenobacteraceae bacterium]
MSSASAPLPEASAPPTRALVLAAFAALYVIWGSTYLAIRFAIEAMPPLLMAGTRSVLAGALLYGYARGMRREPAASARGWGHALVVGAGLLLVGNGGVTLAEQYVPSGLASLLVATVPMWLAVLGWLSGVGARPRPLVWLGLALGLAGVGLLAGGPADAVADAHVGLPGHHTLGIGLLLTASLTWAAASLYSRKYTIAPTVLVSVAMQMLCGGSLLCLAGLLMGEAQGLDFGQVTPRAWWAWLYLIGFGSLIGFTAYAWLLRVVEPALVGTYAFVNPVVAVGLGWAFAGEKLTTAMGGGAALIVVAVALVVLGARSPARGSVDKEAEPVAPVNAVTE